MAKRGQVLGYAALGMILVDISAKSGIPKSTCSDIIRAAKQNAERTGNPDLFALENLAPKPNRMKGANKVLTPAEEQALCALATSDADHCRMTLHELSRES